MDEGKELASVFSVCVVQLEHKEFGDLAWVARAPDGKLSDFTPCTALADTEHQIPRTKLMPQRWMH